MMLSTTFKRRIELFNECTIIVLVYTLLCFTDFVPDPEVRSSIGTFFVGLCCFNLSVHLVILLGTSGK